MKEAVYNTSSYFKYDYEDSWIVDPFVKEMIQDVDKSTVLDSGVIDSPVLGKIPPTELSGGVKTLILFKFNKDKIFNASTCGDNCAKWLLKIAESEDRTINLRHLMDFGKEPFTIRILNTNEINASTCGDNCAKWLLKIAESEDRTVNLRHLMDFGKEPFTIRILNTNEIVHSMKELVPIAGEFV